jgi:outer membrane autotransporter protein
MILACTASSLSTIRGAAAPLALSAAIFTSAAASADPLTSLYADVPISYAQLASGSVPRARVEAIPGVAVGEPDIAAPSPLSPLPVRAWASGFGFHTRVGADRNGPGYRTEGGGGTIGVDRFFTPNFLAGVALSFTHSDTKGVATSSEADTVSGAVYAAWIPIPGLEFEGVAGIDASDLDTKRIILTVPTRGETESFGFSAAANVGYRFRLPGPFSETFFKPFAGFTYSSQRRDGYTEFSAFGPAFVYPTKTFERSTFNLGAAAGFDIAAGGGWTIRPELRIAWSRHLDDPAPPVRAFLAGTPVVLRDPSPGRDGAIVAAEVTGINGGVQLFAGYAGEFRTNSTAHQGRIGLRLTW